MSGLVCAEDRNPGAPETMLRTVSFNLHQPITTIQIHTDDPMPMSQRCVIWEEGRRHIHEDCLKQAGPWLQNAATKHKQHQREQAKSFYSCGN